jgi:hypothetical protein
VAYRELAPPPAVALGVGADELLGSSPALGDVWRDGDELTERVAGAAGPRERLALLVGAVAARLETAPPPDPIIRRAVLDLSRPRRGSAGSPSAWPSPSASCAGASRPPSDTRRGRSRACCACSASSPLPAPMAAISRGSRSMPGMPISLTSRATAPRSAGFRPPRWSPAAPARPASVS